MRPVMRLAGEDFRVISLTYKYMYSVGEKKMDKIEEELGKFN